MGIIGFDDDITDYSPDGVTARAEAARSALRELGGVSAADDVDVVTVAAMRERLGTQGIAPRPSTPDELGAHLRSEIAKWRKVVDEARIQLE